MTFWARDGQVRPIWSQFAKNDQTVIGRSGADSKLSNAAFCPNYSGFGDKVDKNPPIWMPLGSIETETAPVSAVCRTRLPQSA